MPLSHHRQTHPELVDRLLQSRRSNRSGHACLFIGDTPDDAQEFAMDWLQACLCRSPQADGDACGTCDNCHRLATGNYPELFIIRPQSKSRAIVVDQVHELLDFLGLSVGPGKKKIGLILEADCMGVQAQNAFLKTLEEPDGRTVLALCTTQPRQLLPTIKSRCQVVSLLKNRCGHAEMQEKGLFEALAALVPGADTLVGLQTGEIIRTIAESLEDEAKEFAASRRDPRWQKIAEQNSSMRTRLKEQEEAEERAEYLRRRAALLEGIQTWYQQLELIAHGIPYAKVPHAELFGGSAPTVPHPEAFPFINQSLRRLSYCLATNAKEALAIDAFCLEICRIRISL
jgi:hypothetical protein